MARAQTLPCFERSLSRACVRRRSCLVLVAAALLTAFGANAQTKTATPGQKNPAAQAQPLASPQLSAEQVAANLHAQKVQDLVGRAQASYQSGVANYNADRLDAARMDFDFAVDTMLSSGMDLKNDPVLSDDFERLLSAINSLEMVALQQGNGFSPKVEPAPLEDALKDVTFAPDPALVNKVQTEIQTTKSDLPLVVNDYVAGFISYFTNSPAGHAHLKRSLERAGKYKDMVQRVLRENGVPQDLIYLAVAESGFQPQALNRSSGAGGMWQFMPFAGAYGLERNGYFDERFDPEKSSVAYAKYMKYLYAQFGDWYLAMAAYDWGPGNVQRVVSRTGYADYWELYRHGVLPGETKAYVPGIIAAAIMAKNPQQYGLTDLVPDTPVMSDKVTTSYAIDLKLVADLTNTTVANIVELNPALLRLVTPRDIPYDLHLPHGTRDLYLKRLQEIPEDDRASWRFHVVKTGETLESIAESLHSHASDIAQYNEVTPSGPIGAGDELVVPVATPRAAAAGQQHYTFHRGDTLVKVADRFGVTVEQLRTWNHLSASVVKPGRSLYVAEPVRLAPGGGGRRGRGRRGRGASAGSVRGKKGASETAARRGKSASRPHAAASSRGSSHHAAASPAHGTSHTARKHSR